ncbi:pyridoxamine 5'-phosphate oxidase family protein [Streptomyces sp. ICBB 8177]|uniref:pyridoxamine 5'-phosphate oxidase family protein n=1 Tax=Streptomyces sp. ICBB 8177 TaxID=563922 RepID=UPI000D67B196|nr:pyridoxamine 5'-phosphate oxidase family protein [Streptomyces sp. ICBB 8177]PWI42510.1 nitrilase [Streptomyces sp. ICBB 8177]
MSIDLGRPGPDFLAFWRTPLYSALTTPRPDGTPHVAPVGATYDPEARLARVTARRTSVKVRNVLAAGAPGLRAALCQVDGGHWATLEGVARVSEAPEAIAEAVHRYEERYGRKVNPNPDRVVIEIALTRAMGRIPAATTAQRP